MRSLGRPPPTRQRPASLLPLSPSHPPLRAHTQSTQARARKHARMCTDKDARARADKGAQTHVGTRTHSRARALARKRSAPRDRAPPLPTSERPAPQLGAVPAPLFEPRAPSSSPVPRLREACAPAPTHLAPVPASPSPARAPSRRPRGQGAQPHGRPGARGELGPGQARTGRGGH